MIDIQRYGQHLVAQPHVDDREVREHAEVEADVLAVVRTALDPREVGAVGLQAEVVVVALEVFLGVSLAADPEAHALRLEVGNLLRWRQPRLSHICHVAVSWHKSS